jgi:hypothetical protein
MRTLLFRFEFVSDMKQQVEGCSAMPRGIWRWRRQWTPAAWAGGKIVGLISLCGARTGILLAK